MKKVFSIHRGVNSSKVTQFKSLIDDLNEYKAVFDKEVVHHEGLAATELYLRELIRPYSIIALFVGNDSHDVRYFEYELSRSRNRKKRVAFHIRGTEDGLHLE